MGSDFGKKLLVAALFSAMSIFFGKVLVDRCIPDYGFRIFKGEIPIPAPLCQSVAQLDNIRRGAFSVSNFNRLKGRDLREVILRSSYIDSLGIYDVSVILSSNFRDRLILQKVFVLFISYTAIYLIGFELFFMFLAIFLNVLEPIFRKPLPVHNEATRDLLDNFKSKRLR